MNEVLKKIIEDHERDLSSLEEESLRHAAEKVVSAEEYLEESRRKLDSVKAEIIVLRQVINHLKELS